jgi:hypothetical protein
VVTKSKIVVIAVIAASSYAAPVFAQSFNRTEGTGNELPSYYDSNGGLHVGIAPQNTRGLYAFASVRHAISGYLRWPGWVGIVISYSEFESLGYGRAIPIGALRWAA